MPLTASNRHRLHDLISRQADGLITAEEHRELTTALETDPEARKAWYLRNDIDLALATKAAGRREELLAPFSVVNPGFAANPGGFSKRFRAAALAGPVLAAAGVAVGVFGASAVWAFTVPRSPAAETVVRVFSESFEGSVAATVPALPRGLRDPAGNVWRGDEARVVTARQGVAPVAGAWMLAFERSTFVGEDSPASAWSDVYRFVDARPLLVLAEGGGVTARLSASFALALNACADAEAYSASVRIYAFDRDIADSPDPLPLNWVLDNCVASGMKKVPLVCGQAGWQRVSVDASLPPNAKFFLLHVSAVRDVPGPSSEPAVFRGHFVDDISLELHESRGLR
ncbi:MAG: hypothetical protein WD072_00570 [Pirellulales bacterium]